MSKCSRGSQEEMSIRQKERRYNDMYQGHLDDAFGEVTICGYLYSSGAALKEIDPIAYREGFNNFMDMLHEDGEITDDEYEDIVCEV